jgi:hypothetical protein
MSRLSVNKIERLVEAYVAENTDWYSFGQPAEKVPGILGTWTMEAQHPWEENNNSRWFVYKLEHPETGVRYFRKDGYNVSHDGVYWDGAFYEVKPVTKQVVVWE